MRNLLILTGLLLTMEMQPAMASSRTGLVLGLSLGGGPSLSKINGEYSSTASGTSSFTIGGAFDSGLELSLLVENSNVQPLRGGRSESVLPTGYVMDINMVGARLGQRFGRWHIWADGAYGNMEESSDDRMELLAANERGGKRSVAHSRVGAGLGFEFAKWDSTSLELFASLKHFSRLQELDSASHHGPSILQQTYGIAFNTYPSMWNLDGGSGYFGYRPLHIYCFDCGRGLVDLFASANLMAKVGTSFTQMVFSALR